MPLNDDEKRELLRIARGAVGEWGYTGRLPPGKPHKKALLEPGAAFVSLHRGAALRGCIGTTRAEKPIYQCVQEMAVAAATRDPRFGPVEAEELHELLFEVSVLGPCEPIRAPADVRIGIHGISIVHDQRRGLLLPQVAAKRTWSAEEFLIQACVKAGLPEDGWKHPQAVVERFEAESFDESGFPPIDPMSLL